MAAWFDRNRHLYPPDWPEIARTVKDAAGWRCEACGVAHGPVPCVLTVDHFDHEPGNSDPANLIPLCQVCHLRRQGLYPRPATREEAIRRLAERARIERTQLALEFREA